MTTSAKRFGSPNRNAFTLVELLVVIAIIGVLVALLLPAVQAARESARRMHCTNNIKQISLAMHSYHGANGYFPYNWFDNDWGGSSKAKSWMMYILPYIEQQQIFDQIEFGERQDHPANVRVSGMSISGYFCPSDPDVSTPDDGPTAKTSYKGCAGSNWEGGWYTGSDSGNPWHWPSPSGRFIGESFGHERGNGIIHRGYLDYSGRRAVPVLDLSRAAERQITDGLSHTFAVGETVSTWVDPGPYWFTGWTNFGTCAMPPNYQKPGVSREEAAPDWPNTWGYHSLHTGGVNMGMCDGSVHFITDGIDLSLYRSLSQIDDGEVASLAGK